MKTIWTASFLFLTACATSTHPTEKADLGVARSSEELLAVLEAAGPITVETIASADWAITRAGLVNLEHEKAIAAGLEDGDEPIRIYFHVIRHPTKGTFIIDTGMEKAMRDDPDNALISGLIASAMNADQMKVNVALGDWIAKERAPLAGVFLTHLHLDHVTGLPDVPRGTPIYIGPGETDASAFQNLFVQGVIDDALEGHTALRELAYPRDASGRFAGLLDLFGDGSFWAIWVPGHTPGSTAFLARTESGPVLFTGDASHTAWGWQNEVEPGDFTRDHAASVDSLNRLEQLVKDHPSITVRLGHQDLPGQAH